MTDARGFRMAMIILALAWLANFAALLFAAIEIPGALSELYVLWGLIASAAAVIGAVLTRGFSMVGVALYIVAALSLIVKAYFVVAGTGEPMPMGWPYILGLVVYVLLVASVWQRFGRPNA